MQLTLTSPTLPMSQLDDYAETIIMPRMSMINGVSQVQVQGQQKYAVRVQVDPDKLVSKRIGLNEVDAAIANWNPNLPTGTLFGPQQTYTVTTNAELKNAEQFANVIVSWRNGAPVRLGEIADVVDSVQDTRQAAWMYNADSQQRSIQLQVMRQPGANTIAVTDAIREVLPSLQAQIPPSANVRVRFDRSRNIRASFKDIQVTMLITLVLVIGVIFVFLRNASATIIPSMALPFALLGTFAVMAVLELQPGSVVADGADSLHRIRGGRRHRDARKHHAPHRARRGAVRGGAQGLQGNRLHHHFHDRVAGGGVHSGAVHGRASWDACSASSR